MARMAMSDPLRLKLGTRASPLAMAQAEFVAERLTALSSGALAFDIVRFTTSGDQLTTERLINSGGKGLFTKEIDAAVSDGRCDLAVHSLKDVPSDLPPGQVFIAFTERVDPREAFICHTVSHPRDLAEGAVVGTASLRREAQTLALRPDLKIVPFRGRVETRLRKLDAGEADATWLAMAGLTRLGLEAIAHPIALDDMLPAAGQGIICCVGRDEGLSEILLEACDALNHPRTQQAAIAERAFLAELDGSCRTAIAAHLFDGEDGGFRLRGEVLSPDGRQRWAGEQSAPAGASLADLAGLGAALGREIRAAAGGALPQFADG